MQKSTISGNLMSDRFLHLVGVTLIGFLLISCGGTSSSPSLNATAQAQIDTLVNNFMTTNSINAASITIMNSGNVLYDKSYGYLDSGHTTQIGNDPLMVTASIVKPLTAATVQSLASSGVLHLSDYVFCTGANTPCWLHVADPNGTQISLASFHDSRYANITIQQLIDHEGGWDRTQASCYGASSYSNSTVNGVSVTNPTPCDPMIQEYLIQQTLHSSFPGSFSATQLPTQMNDIYYWVTKNSLDFVPGSAQAYSNFGYMLLTAIVATATGSDFTPYAYNTILAPLGVASTDLSVFSFAPATNSPQALRTPSMQTLQQCPSVYSSNNGSTIFGTAQGCLNPANWMGAATMLTTSKAMATLAGLYRIDNSTDLGSGTNVSVDGPNNGKSLNGQTNAGVHYGDLPGVTNIIRQLSSGTSYALMLSKDNPSGGPGIWEATLYPQIDSIISSANY